MARRKKEPEGAHRQAIAQAAQRLYAQKGISVTTMDDIAREAGYSKATLYVYFQNKDEITGALALDSMRLLAEHIHQACSGAGGFLDKYRAVCQALAQYQEQYPAYFDMAKGEIRLPAEQTGHESVAWQIFEVGEQINRELAALIEEGVKSGAVRPGLPVMQTVFVFWGALSGLIELAAKKQAYLERALGQTRQEFLSQGFDILYRAVIAGEAMQ